MKNYYQILEISESNSQEEIKNQYRFLVQAWHPDKFRSLENKAKAEEKLKQINEAYDVLGNPTKREKYDRQSQFYSQESSEKARQREQAEAEKRKQEERDKAQAEEERHERETRDRERQRAQAEAERRKQKERNKAAEEEKHTKENNKGRSNKFLSSLGGIVFVVICLIGSLVILVKNSYDVIEQVEIVALQRDVCSTFLSSNEVEKAIQANIINSTYHDCIKFTVMNNSDTTVSVRLYHGEKPLPWSVTSPCYEDQAPGDLLAPKTRKTYICTAGTFSWVESYSMLVKVQDIFGSEGATTYRMP